MRIAKRQFGETVAPVHRLDRATSGCLLLSLDPTTTARLQAALSAGDKRYLALVRGAVDDLSERHVTTPIKDPRKGVQSAESFVQPIATSRDPRCSLFLARPVTGRNHQVRRHCRDLDHPVIGDGKHGDSRVNRWWREHLELPRLALHCLSLRIETEQDGSIDVTCPVPRDLLAVFERLPWYADAVRALPQMVATDAADGTETPT